MKKKLFLVSRILLGLIFTVFGLNGFLMVVTGSGFIPTPPPPPEMMGVMEGMMKLVYLLPLAKALQVIAGVLLLSGRFLNLAIVFIGPIIVNILCIHLFIDKSGLPMAIVITVLFAIVVKGRWDDFKMVLKK